MKDKDGWNVITVERKIDDSPNRMDVVVEGAFSTQLAFATFASDVRVFADYILNCDITLDASDASKKMTVTTRIKYKTAPELDLIDLYKIILQMKGYEIINIIGNSKIIAQWSGSTWMLIFAPTGTTIMVDVYIVQSAYTLQNISEHCCFCYSVPLGEFLITPLNKLNELNRIKGLCEGVEQ